MGCFHISFTIVCVVGIIAKSILQMRKTTLRKATQSPLCTGPVWFGIVPVWRSFS